MLAIAMQQDSGDPAILTSHQINNDDGNAKHDPQGVADVIRVELGNNIPDQILLIENDVVVAAFMLGEEYNFEDSDV